MTGFIARRLSQSAVVVFAVTLIVFVIIHLLPGGPAAALLGERATPAQIHAFDVANGYNKPIWSQYVTYVDRLLHGNLGYSYAYNEPVGSLLEQALPKSALLVGLAVIVAAALAIPIGMLQAVQRNRPVDYILTGLAFIGYSMPTFWLGILLIMGLSVSARIFPAQGPQGATVGAVLQQPLALVLPVMTFAIVMLALFSRFVRSSTIENLVQDYVRTARAKGVPKTTIIRHHVLRNSVTPVITLLGLSLPSALSGGIIVESLFNYPGMGLLFWKAATTHDYPLLMGFTVVIGVAAVVGNLLADLAYGIADPRIRSRSLQQH
jgi:ABC-type dipeptide/oligopeptide/nickel transport systems, permease components